MASISLTDNWLVRYFKESREELSKVAWPGRRTVVSHTGMVIAVCLVLAAFLGIVDYGLTYGFEQLIVR